MNDVKKNLSGKKGKNGMSENWSDGIMECWKDEIDYSSHYYSTSTWHGGRQLFKMVCNMNK